MMTKNVDTTQIKCNDKIATLSPPVRWPRLPTMFFKPWETSPETFKDDAIAIIEMSCLGFAQKIHNLVRKPQRHEIKENTTIYQSVIFFRLQINLVAKLPVQVLSQFVHLSLNLIVGFRLSTEKGFSNFLQLL